MQLPILVARRHLHVPGGGRVGSIDLHAMFDRVPHFVHFVFEPEPPQDLAGFAGERLTNVKARKLFLLENDRLDSFANEEHRRRRATRAATNNEYVCFHKIKAEISSSMPF